MAHLLRTAVLQYIHNSFRFTIYILSILLSYTEGIPYATIVTYLLFRIYLGITPNSFWGCAGLGHVAVSVCSGLVNQSPVQSTSYILVKYVIRELTVSKA